MTWPPPLEFANGRKELVIHRTTYLPEDDEARPHLCTVREMTFSHSQRRRLDGRMQFDSLDLALINFFSIA